MENITDGPKVYRVPEQNYPVLESRIAKLAKRAAKLGIPAPTVAIVAIDETRETRDGVTRLRRIFSVTITGEAPKLAGWAFAAVLQPTVDEAGVSLGNILRVVPGFEQAVPAQFRAAGNNCDHCHTSRRRNETFVLVNEAGEWKQVGRSYLMA